jgi:hypothetical protein
MFKTTALILGIMLTGLACVLSFGFGINGSALELSALGALANFASLFAK